MFLFQLDIQKTTFRQTSTESNKSNITHFNTGCTQVKPRVRNRFTNELNGIINIEANPSNGKIVDLMDGAD